MTLRDCTSQIFKLSVAGYINGEKFIYNRFDKMVRAMFGGDAKKYIGEICLPDGHWWFKIFRLKNGEYDYYIPETKEQNAILAKELTLNKNQQEKASADCWGLNFDLVFDMVFGQSILMLAINILMQMLIFGFVMRFFDDRC